jgi:hypothetical protein
MAAIAPDSAFYQPLISFFRPSHIESDVPKLGASRRKHEGRATLFDTVEDNGEAG